MEKEGKNPDGKLMDPRDGDIVCNGKEVTVKFLLIQLLTVPSTTTAQSV